MPEQPQPQAAPTTALIIRKDSVNIRLASDGRDGLVGYASLIIEPGIALNNISIRRGASGELFLTYPRKQSRAGAKYSLFNPTDHKTQIAIESAVLAALAQLSRDASSGSHE